MANAVTMTSMRTVAAALAALSLVMLIAVQFVPWATATTSAFGFTAKATVTTWEAEMDASGFGSDGSDSHGWYSDDADDADGIDQIRMAIPFILGALVLALVATLLGFLMAGAGGPIVTLIAALAAIAGTVMFAMGVDSFFGDTNYDWAASFYLAIAASTMLLVGGIVGLVGGNQQVS